MEMGGRAEDSDINVLFLFISLFSDGNLSTFGLLVMEGYSRRRVRISLQVRCGGRRGGRRVLVKGGIMENFACHLVRIFSSDELFLGRGDGSARVLIARMCYSGMEESRRACLTFLGEDPVTGFPSEASDEGVLTVVELWREIFVLILADREMLFCDAEHISDRPVFLDPCG